MLFVMISFGVMIYIEVPKLVKEGYWRELAFFSGFMIIAFIMSILFVKGLPIFNPIKYMEYVVKDLLHLNYQ